MFSIGDLSKQTGVKVPTIRYYEGAGLIQPIGRTDGNQRRYGPTELQRLTFIKHARDLGFSLEDIAELIELHNQPDQSCTLAGEIAQQQLSDVRNKIERLMRLETELSRIVDGCQGSGSTQECYVLNSLSDHALCETDHQ